MIIGNPSLFSIESEVIQVYNSLSQRALGFFVVYVNGKPYGIHEPDATMLGLPFESVERRVFRRGTHVAPFGSSPDPVEISIKLCVARYREDFDVKDFFGLTQDEFIHFLISNEIDWSPDGDEAFDDSSHILQFDQGNKVRLIVFKNDENQEDIARSVEEIWLNRDAFYGILEGWAVRFKSEWEQAVLKLK